MRDNKNFAVIHVTNVYSPFIGGITTYIKLMCHALNHRKIKNMVLPYPYRFWQLELEIKSAAGRRIMHRMLVMPFVFYSLLFIFRHRCGTNVIVHSHSAAFCMIVGAISKALFGCGTVHTFHSPIDNYSSIIKLYRSRIDTIVFVSNAAKKLYEKVEQIKFEHYEIVPGSIDFKVHSPPMDRELKELGDKVREEHNLSEDSHVLLFVGRIIEQKGVFELVTAFSEIKEVVPQAVLVMVGPYKDSEEQIAAYQKLRALIKTKKIRDIIFTGRMSSEKIIELYRVSDICVFPSRWPEMSPIVVVEAMACGKPVVTTDTGGLPERVVNGVTGFIVQKGDIKQLRDVILKLLKDRELRERMGKAARREVETKYTIERITDKYVSIYKRSLE